MKINLGEVRKTFKNFEDKVKESENIEKDIVFLEKEIDKLDSNGFKEEVKKEISEIKNKKFNPDGKIDLDKNSERKVAVEKLKLKIKAKKEADSYYENALIDFNKKIWVEAKINAEKAKEIYGKIGNDDGISKCDKLLSQIPHWDPTPIKLEIKRTVYDPVTRSFVSKNKLDYPEISKWLDAHPPDYWYILRIDNLAGTVEQWAVELETQKAVSVNEAFIDGIDCTPLLETDTMWKDKRWKNKYIFSVPKEKGIPLPSNGVKRLYFRLNINCNIVLQSMYAVSGNVIADELILPIKEKKFPYSCDLIILKNIWEKMPKDVEKYLEDKDSEYKSIKNSTATEDRRRSAYYCCDLIKMNLGLGKASDALKYCLDMQNYAFGKTKEEVEKLAEDLEARVKNGFPISNDFSEKAEVIMHKVKMGWT